MNEITPKPFEDAARSGERPEMWVQEAIFGHRFIEEQKPYMLVLEVLSICGSVLRKGGVIFSHGPVDATRSEAITASVAKRGPLRYLLFEDTSLDRIRSDEALTESEKLDRLVTELNKGFRGRARVDNAFDYLRERFRGRFSALVQAIDILRSMEIDALTSRRWTSRFLAPRGPHLQLSDIDISLSADRRFFGRGGELMYLMLSRSRKASGVADLVRREFFSNEDPMDRLLAEIDPGSEERTGDVPLGYLPLVHHSSYDRLAEDWIAVLGLAGLPSPQKFEPLFRLSALNLVRYFMERAAEVGDLSAADGRPIVEPIVLDVSSGAISDMRQRAASHLRRVRETIDEAVETYIRTTIERQPKWQQAKRHSDTDLRSRLAVEAIQETFNTDILEKERPSRRSPDACLSFFVKKATARSRNNVSTLIEPLGKNAGFITARQRAGTWFDGSDEFLEALVVGNSGAEAMTVDHFLSRIFERYRIVIGPNEAARAFVKRTFDPSSFEENAREFERRLTGLGYVRRLSDDCAFVSNPYAQ